MALSIADHQARSGCRAAVEGRRLGLSGHAAFETFSVLTRLPPPTRRTGRAVSVLLAHNVPHTVFLDSEAASDPMTRLPEVGISGGAVYDAPVGMCALRASVPLVTRDRRALVTYRALEMDVVLVE